MRFALFMLFVSVSLAGCGFHPVHSVEYQRSLDVNLSQVAIETDSSRLGQLLKAEIRDQVNPAAAGSAAKYRLSIRLRETDIPLFINPDGTSARGDMQYQSTYDLVRVADHVVISHGDINRLASYNSSPTADYGSFVSQEDAKKRAMLELAQDYKLRLANLLPKINDPSAKAADIPAALPPTIPETRDPHEIRRTGF